MTSRAPLILADLEQSPGDVELPSTKRVVRVIAMTGAAVQLWTAINDDYRKAKAPKPGDPPIADIGADRLWQLATILLPDATQEEINALGPASIGAIVLIAMGHAEAVARLVDVGKAAALAQATASAATPASPSGMPSATSSPVSPAGKDAPPATS